MSVLAPELASAGLIVGERVSETDPKSEDADLVKRTIAGDEAAFKRLVSKYQRLAHHTAYGFLNDEHMAHDVSQEAFVRVFRKLRSYDPSRSFATWLRRIVANLSIDELRRRRRRPEAPLDEGMAEGGDKGADPVARAERAEEQEAVWRVLDRLPIKYRTVMVLREIEGLPYEEIAQVLRKPEASVRWRLHRARKLFREEWLAMNEAERVQ